MSKVAQFVKEAMNELGKVTWPSRPMVLRLTLGVIVVSILFALFVGLVDIGITRSLRGLLIWAGQNQQADTVTSTPPIEVGNDGIEVETSQ